MILKSEKIVSLKNNQKLMQAKTPIVVYQMGKVGSETIENSVRALSLPNPVYHIHCLAPKNVAKKISYFSNKNMTFPLQLKNSLLLQNEINTRDNYCLKVITGVREPISQIISSLFQNITEHVPHFLDPDGRYKTSDIHNHLYNRISSYDTQEAATNCNWFDSEFKPALGIDVYDYKFNLASGYSVINYKNIDILILRLESSENWHIFIADFLGLPDPVKISKKNTSNTKSYRYAYEQVLLQLKFSPSTLQKIYSSQYCQHFYSKKMIEGFIHRWSA